MLNADTVWAAAVVEALNLDPHVQTRVGPPHASFQLIQKNTQLHDSSGLQPPKSHLLSPKAQCALSRGLVDAMWAAANGEALNLGRLGALMMLTHVSRLLQGRELPGSILGSLVFIL